MKAGTVKTTSGVSTLEQRERETTLRLDEAMRRLEFVEGMIRTLSGLVGGLTAWAKDKAGLDPFERLSAVERKIKKRSRKPKEWDGEL